MLNVSETYKQAIDADIRHIIPRVLVYFSEIPTEFTVDEVISLHLLEEAKAETGNPLGAVSSNELTITLDNSNCFFNPTNTASPYYGLLKPNVKVEAFLAVKTAAGTYEETPLGTFYTAEWSEGTVTGYDSLYTLGGMDVPMIKTQEDTTIGRMFAALFDAMEVANYSIDPGLDQTIRIGWLPNGSTQQALQALCVAGNCFINVDRTGVIRVQKNALSGVPVSTLTDDNQIIRAVNPQKYLDIYNQVKVTYCRPRLGKRDTILNMDGIEIESGTSEIDKTHFNAAPIGKVERISINHRANSSINTLSYDAWSVLIGTVNPGSAEIVNIIGRGYPLNLTYRDRTTRDDALIAEWGLKELVIQNDLIQDSRVARTYAQDLLALVADPFRGFELEIRGNPALEIGDIIEISDPTDNIPLTNIAIERITLDYDGGLSGSISGRRVG